MRVATFFLSLLSIGIVPVSGVEFSSVDLKPLIQQRSSTRLQADPPLGSGRSDLTRMITRGGGLLQFQASGSGVVGPGSSFFNSRWVRGVGSSASFLRLRQVLAEGRVGLQRDCSLPFFDDVIVITGTVEVIWYGAQGRRNAFTVTYFGPSETPPTPLCSVEIQQILSGMNAYLAAVEREPDTEILDSGE
jgi:hypothetical protein